MDKLIKRLPDYPVLPVYTISMEDDYPILHTTSLPQYANLVITEVGVEEGILELLNYGNCYLAYRNSIALYDINHLGRHNNSIIGGIIIVAEKSIGGD